MNTDRPIKIAICIPSRGLGHYRTLIGVIREIESVNLPHVWCWAIGLPIPDCANDITSQALADPDVTHIWYCEDDLLLPVGVLEAMLRHDAPVVAVDYRMRNGIKIHTRDPRNPGQALHACLGMTLVQREVVASLPWPPFQANTAWTFKNGTLKPKGGPSSWGYHDLYFSALLRQAGHAITILPGFEAGHLEVVEQASRTHRTNNGADVERCYGGQGIPWRPVISGALASRDRRGRVRGTEPVTTQTRVIMADQVYLQSPAGMVIDMDKRSPNYQRKLRQGWTEIKASEAKPILKVQEAHNAEVVERVNRAHASDTVDDDDD